MIHGSGGFGCPFFLVSMTMMPVTCSSGVTVPGVEDTQRMMTASQVCHVFKIWNGIGGWPLWPAMKALRVVNVGVPSYPVLTSLFLQRLYSWNLQWQGRWGIRC